MSSAYSLKVPKVGDVRVQKRKGMKSIRLRVTPKGELVVSAPWYVSRSIISSFLLERIDWMIEHSTTRRVELKDGMKFGRNLLLRITDGAKSNRTKFYPTETHVFLKDAYDQTNTSQQKYIEQKILKALQLEAEHTLLPRLHSVSTEIGFSYNQAYIKNLTGRWGSCDSHQNILLSMFLVQLPDNLIDYVIIHELAHTRHMNHSPKFWETVAGHCPDYKTLRKKLKEQDPRITER